MAQTPPPSAERYYATSALVAKRAVAKVAEARPRGILAMVRELWTHQMSSAVVAERAVAQMLAEQDIDAAAEALLNSTAFTTEVALFESMLDAATDQPAVDRMVESIVQDAARVAESVAGAVRPNIYHVRYVSPPCCGRCAVLAGRVYRWSDGFLRHPNCDCVMVPTTVAAPFAQDPDQLVADGLVRGLSKADQQALTDGADLAQVVNVRRRSAGLSRSGRSLARAGRPTPDGIYRIASDRDEAVALLRRFGYIT